MLDKRLQDRLRCTKCQSSQLELRDGSLTCIDCQATFPVEYGIPKFLDVTSTKGAEFDYLEHYVKDAEMFDYFEDRYGATEHAERRLREYILREIPTGVTSLLDVGCGSAWVAKAMQKREIFLCSHDATIINTRKALDLYPSTNHVAVVADAFHLPFKDNSFGCIIASEIIEHVVVPEAFVKELVRVLSVGGRLIVSTPYKEVLKYTLCIHCNEKTPLNAHIQSFDEQRLKEIGTRAGASSSQWKTFGNKVLSYLRTYTALQYLPHAGWRAVDTIANAAYNRPAHIVIKYTK
jgi:ubiquinone/menaquinone biosynthesis C-methylase UbiE